MTPIYICPKCDRYHNTKHYIGNHIVYQTDYPIPESACHECSSGFWAWLKKLWG